MEVSRVKITHPRFSGTTLASDELLFSSLISPKLPQGPLQVQGPGSISPELWGVEGFQLDDSCPAFRAAWVDNSDLGFRVPAFRVVSFGLSARAAGLRIGSQGANRFSSRVRVLGFPDPENCDRGCPRQTDCLQRWLMEPLSRHFHVLFCPAQLEFSLSEP